MKKTCLCAIKLTTDNDFEEGLKETINLCESCNLEVVETFIQKSRSLDPNMAIRKGKIEEIKNYCQENEIEQVVFYNDLNYGILNRLEQELEVDVIDRTTLILDIFSARADTRLSKIQTEIARLKYHMPKLLTNDTAERMQGGALYNKGKGETRKSLTKRKLEHQITMLTNELKQLEKQQVQASKKRNISGFKKVALVGYTNAGKSSLMNALLKRNKKIDKDVYVKDQLFATLNTSVRKISYQSSEFYLFDTVGFVSRLPHELIKAFETTLSAAKEADLLVQVIDYSNPNFSSQIEITEKTLKDIGCQDIPMIKVFNKSDLCQKVEENLLTISCLKEENLDLVLSKIVETLYEFEDNKTLKIPYDFYNQSLKLQKLGKVKIIKQDDEGLTLILNKNFDENEILKQIKSATN